jgi:lysophospholipase L1-like esterase
MDETYRMLGREHELDLEREAIKRRAAAVARRPRADATAARRNERLAKQLRLFLTRSAALVVRKIRVEVSAAMIVLILGLAALPVSAAVVGQLSQPVYQPPQSYYLALGDSIAYGFQPTKKPGARASRFDTGYVDVFAARLRKLSPKIQVVNYGCPGESTVTFVRHGCPALADGFKLHDTFRGPQLKAAQSFLRAHPGQVSPITLTLWGNDWFSLLLDRCKSDVACVRKRGPATIQSLGSRLTSILERLRAAAPTAEIIVTGAWNVDPDQLEELRPIYRSLDASIALAASASRARVAKALPVFNPPGNVGVQRRRLCALTFICSKGDPHPTDAGYRALADAFMTASGYARKP